jgi:hypothetical protein
MQKGIFSVIFLSLILSILFTSCGEDENSVTTPPPGGGGFTLSGTISGYPGGSVIAKAKITKFVPPDSFFVGTDTVDNNAQLSMSLVTPPTDFLIPIIVPSGITVSDTTATITTFAELGAYNFSGSVIAKIRKKNFQDTNIVEGSFLVQYIFSTKAVTVIGSDTVINLNDTNISAYNLNLLAGWNTISIRLTTLRPNFQLTDFVSGELTGAAWRYETSLIRRFNVLNQ